MTELTDAATLTISRITVPESLESADAGPFLEMVRLANAVCVADAGHDYLNETAEEVLGFWQDQSDWTQIGIAAEARARGIRTIQSWTLHRPDTEGQRLAPPTGFGAIPADDRQTVFMREN